MKIKKLGKSMVAVALGAAMCFSTLAFVGCGDNDDGPDIDIVNPADGEITVTLDKNTMQAGSQDTVTVTVEVKGLTDKTYGLSLTGDGANYVQLIGNVVSFKSGVTPANTVTVSVVATSTVSNLVTGSAVITIKPQVIEGVVDELTTSMFTELGNANITVTGTVTDIYQNFNDHSKDWQRDYDFNVKMNDGAWYGEWHGKNSTNRTINNYRRSENTFENTGLHTMNEVYVNKNNKVDQKVVKDYQSIPAYWENQHLWNHLSDFGTDIQNMWKHDVSNDVYIYQNGPELNEDGTDFSADMYFRTYLAYSLTPMLEDTLNTIAITVENGKITGMIAETQKLYDYDEDPTFVRYTVLTCEFVDIGKTEVPEPTPYEGDEMTPELAKAIDKMKAAKNYTFNAVETTVSAPSIDPDDYTEYSVNSVSKARAGSTSSTGTEGVVGLVTEDAILLTKTGKYSAGMTDELYWHETTGYIQLNENTYDYFAYSSDIKAYQGQKQYKGNMFDKMPGFDFAPELFEYVGDQRMIVGGSIKYYPQFALKEPAITRAIAEEVSAHSYASNASSETFGTFIITLDDNGNLYKTEYPYNLVSGSYLGMIETTYSKVGTTVIAEGTFDGYEARVIRDSWSQYQVKYYHPDHSTQSGYGEIDAGTLFGQVFGAEAKNLPSPKAFYEVFGDNMTECFFEWDDIYDEVSGELTGYQDWISFNISVDKEYADENMHLDLAAYSSFIDKLTARLAQDGFKVEPGSAYEAKNSAGNVYARFITYTNGNIAIKIENITTRFFYVDVLPVSKLNG